MYHFNITKDFINSLLTDYFIESDYSLQNPIKLLTESQAIDLEICETMVKKCLDVSDNGLLLGHFLSHLWIETRKLWTAIQKNQMYSYRVEKYTLQFLRDMVGQYSDDEYIHLTNITDYTKRLSQTFDIFNNAIHINQKDLDYIFPSSKIIELAKNDGGNRREYNSILNIGKHPCFEYKMELEELLDVDFVTKETKDAFIF